MKKTFYKYMENATDKHLLHWQNKHFSHKRSHDVPSVNVVTIDISYDQTRNEHHY